MPRATRGTRVQGLDFKADIVSFTWSIVAPGVVGHVNWETRVDDLADENTKPFIWVKTAEQILDCISRRLKRINGARH